MDQRLEQARALASLANLSLNFAHEPGVQEVRGMGGISAIAFSVLIAYLLPGLVALYGASLWSPTVARVFSIFLTTESNAGLFLLVTLGSLAVGLILTLARWVLFDCWALKLLFQAERTLFRFSWRGHVLLKGMTCPKVLPISGEDYAYLATNGNKLEAYRAFIDETYRFYQWWGSLAVALPLVVTGWSRHLWRTSSLAMLVVAALGFFALEVAVLFKAADSYVSTQRRGGAILKGGIHGKEAEL